MIIIAFIIAAFNLASSAPVLPSTTDFDPGPPLAIFGRDLPDCVNVARYRTVQDIVWSCLATIFACTWVAVHPNVPRAQASKWTKFWQKVLIMVYALLAPEVVIAWAMRQWTAARRHAAEYNQKHHNGRLFRPRELFTRHSLLTGTLHPDGEKSGLWTMTHGFLLEMHGLVDSSGKPVHFVSEIPGPLDISEEEIGDKSKGDFLTKLLVVLQTTWFIFQCLARWITHLPVTELEVVTLAFALLNIGTYALWWNKPQNMGVAIQMDRYRKPKVAEEQKEATGDDVVDAMLGEHAEAVENVDEACNLLMPKSTLEDRPDERTRFVGRALTAVKLGLGALTSMVIAAFDPRRLRSLTFQDIVKIIEVPFIPVADMISDSSSDSDECEHIFYSSGSDGQPAFCTLIIGTLFGGLHLIPLRSSSFPSSSEKLLWKLSAIWITSMPSLFVAVGVLSAVFEVSLLVLFWGFVGLYFIARLMLVVLAFTTLREIPFDALRNVAWTTFLPHF